MLRELVGIDYFRWKELAVAAVEAAAENRIVHSAAVVAAAGLAVDYSSDIVDDDGRLGNEPHALLPPYTLPIKEVIF